MLINIYCRENNITGDVYIGTTTDTLAKRAGQNFIGYEGCVRFYNAIKKYGVESFTSWIFEIVDTLEQADQAEIFWIAEMRRVLGKDHVYNILDGGNVGRRGLAPHNKGKKTSDEIKRKLSESHKGQKISPENLEKLTASHTGKPLSEEHKKNLSIALTGKKATEATKQKLSESHKGLKQSEETKRKRSIIMSGSNNPNFGKPMSDEQKQKLREANVEREPWNKNTIGICKPNSGSFVKGQQSMARKITDEQLESIKIWYNDGVSTKTIAANCKVSISAIQRRIKTMCDSGELIKRRWTHTDESKKNMSNAHKGKPGFWKGKKLSEEHVNKMVESRKNGVKLG